MRCYSIRAVKISQFPKLFMTDIPSDLIKNLKGAVKKQVVKVGQSGSVSRRRSAFERPEKQ